MHLIQLFLWSPKVFFKFWLNEPLYTSIPNIFMKFFKMQKIDDWSNVYSWYYKNVQNTSKKACNITSMFIFYLLWIKIILRIFIFILRFILFRGVGFIPQKNHYFSITYRIRLVFLLKKEINNTNKRPLQRIKILKKTAEIHIPNWCQCERGKYCCLSCFLF